MAHKIKAKFTKGMSFDIDILGHKLTVDAHKEVGGNDLGPPPKPLMLASLAGCTGMDVVSLLNKMRVQFDSFDIEIEGELSNEHPKKYEKIRVTYILKGKDIPADKVEKAVQMSQDKYCGVAAVYKQVIDLSYSIKINE